jgi:hypothetical protein
MSNEKESPGAPLTTDDKPTMNAFQRLFGIFFSPVKTFQDISRKPSFVLPLVIMIIITVIVTFIVMPKIDLEATMQYEMERKGMEVTDEQIEQVAAIQEKIGKIVAPIVAGGFIIILNLIFAGLYFALLRIWKGGSTFSRVFSVTVFSFFVSVIKQIIALPMAMRLEDKSIMSQEANNIVMTNLAAFLDWETTSRPLYAAATNIDLFNIWTIILTILGLTAVSKLQPKQSAATVLIVWLVWIGFIAGITALTA